MKLGLRCAGMETVRREPRCEQPKQPAPKPAIDFRKAA